MKNVAHRTADLKKLSAYIQIKFMTVAVIDSLQDKYKFIFMKGEQQKMNSLREIGEIVREIRKSNKCSQERFAELIDCSVETVSLIERGVVLISTNTLSKISENCNVSADYILGTGHSPDKEEP